MKAHFIPVASWLSLALILFFPTVRGQEGAGVRGEQAVPQKAPDWDAVEAVPLEPADLLGNWHGVTVEKDYYSVWEIEYKEDGTYKMKGFDRMFDFEKEGEYEDTTWDLTGKWKIGEDGILVCTDDMEPDEEESVIGPLWLKPMKVEADKISYLTVYPEENEDASVAVIYEFKGRASKSLTDLPPVEAGEFKKAE